MRPELSLDPHYPEIRKSLRNQGRNIELLSLEGWCTYLLGCVENSLDLGTYVAVREEFGERWQELKAWDCDPWMYKDYFDEALSARPPIPRKDETEIYKFDPGQKSISRSFTSDLLGPLLPAFAYIRLFEKTGMPMSVPTINMVGDTLKNACRWISPFTGFWSPALLVRAGRRKDLTEEEFLSRTKVAVMDSALAKQIYSWCLRILEREMTSVTGFIAMGSAQESLLEIVSEVLSRLALKVEVAELRRTFLLVLHLHTQLGIRFHPGLHDSCEPWFRRLFEAADSDLLLEWLPQLIKAPLFDDNVQAGHPDRGTGVARPDGALSSQKRVGNRWRCH